MEDVRALARELAHTLAHAHDLTHTLDRALASALTLANALDHDLTINRSRARALASDLASALIHANGYVSALDRALALESALNLAHVLDRVLDRVAKRGGRRVQVREIVAAVERARGLTAQVRGSSAVDGGRDAARAPWGVAVRVTGWLVRVLPVADRAMYREIYWSELFELAQAARPRPAQLGYTLHCLAGVVALRRALRMPASAGREQRR